jgi:hypothetical protein
VLVLVKIIERLFDWSLWDCIDLFLDWSHDAFRWNMSSLKLGRHNNRLGISVVIVVLM